MCNILVGKNYGTNGAERTIRERVSPNYPDGNDDRVPWAVSRVFSEHCVRCETPRTIYRVGNELRNEQIVKHENNWKLKRCN